MIKKTYLYYYSIIAFAGAFAELEDLDLVQNEDVLVQSDDASVQSDDASVQSDQEDLGRSYSARTLYSSLII